MKIMELPIPDADVPWLIMFGLLRRDPDGVLALTPGGADWTLDWLRKKTAALGEIEPQPTEDV